jgi:hypothetical protein
MELNMKASMLLLASVTPSSDLLLGLPNKSRVRCPDDHAKPDQGNQQKDHDEFFC